jgi:hypothetical protein
MLQYHYFPQSPPRVTKSLDAFMLGLHRVTWGSPHLGALEHPGGFMYFPGAIDELWPALPERQ